MYLSIFVEQSEDVPSKTFFREQNQQLFQWALCLGYLDFSGNYMGNVFPFYQKDCPCSKPY